jgi:hypothetical protein
MTCLYRLWRAIDQPQVNDNSSIVAFHPLPHHIEISPKTLLQLFKLWPVGLKAHTRKAYSKLSKRTVHDSLLDAYLYSCKIGSVRAEGEQFFVVQSHFTDWNDLVYRSPHFLEIRSENAFSLGNSILEVFQTNFTCWNSQICPVYDYERKENGT